VGNLSSNQNFTDTGLRLCGKMKIYIKIQNYKMRTPQRLRILRDRLRGDYATVRGGPVGGGEPDAHPLRPGAPLLPRPPPRVQRPPRGGQPTGPTDGLCLHFPPSCQMLRFTTFRKFRSFTQAKSPPRDRPLPTDGSGGRRVPGRRPAAPRRRSSSWRLCAAGGGAWLPSALFEMGM